QKHNPDKRMSICSDCYKQNLADTKRLLEERQRQQQEEQQAKQEAERVAREQEEQRRQARTLELSVQANKQCPRCKYVRTDGQLWILRNGEEHLYFPRYCTACTEATPHLIYHLICPILKQVRYVGITCQLLKSRLGGHMRNEG